MASLKNKDGMGVKRKNSNKASAEASPSNSNVNGYSGEVILANDASVNHIQMIGDFLSNEEAYISQFLSVISQVIEHTHIFRAEYITSQLYCYHNSKMERRTWYHSFWSREMST